MAGLIFSIKRFAIHDGPGIRVTFFMKGCPLSCWWCHNPEGISAEQEMIGITERVGDMEFKRTEEAGRYCSVKDILEVLEKERIFIDESGGGVTFSGGEPVYQTDFLAEALDAASKEGYHTAVDTSGYSSTEYYERIIPFTDLFLYDIKLMDESEHTRYTGVSNSLIMKNFRLILESGRDIFVRIPIIPGFNDDDKNLKAIKQLLADSKCANLKRISLLPYHKIGKAKYTRFGIPYRMNGTEPAPQERMDQLKDFFAETGIETKTGR